METNEAQNQSQGSGNGSHRQSDGEKRGSYNPPPRAEFDYPDSSPPPPPPKDGGDK